MYVSFVLWFLGSREKRSIIGEPVKARACNSVNFNPGGIIEAY